jgi:hypothetical protein
MVSTVLGAVVVAIVAGAVVVVAAGIIVLGALTEHAVQVGWRWGRLRIPVGKWRHGEPLHAVQVGWRWGAASRTFGTPACPTAEVPAAARPLAASRCSPWRSTFQHPLHAAPSPDEGGNQWPSGPAADGGDEGGNQRPSVAISGNQWPSAPSPQIEVARQLSPPMEVAQVDLWGLWGKGAVVSTCMLFEPMEVA